MIYADETNFLSYTTIYSDHSLLALGAWYPYVFKDFTEHEEDDNNFRLMSPLFNCECSGSSFIDEHNNSPFSDFIYNYKKAGE